MSTRVLSSLLVLSLLLAPALRADTSPSDEPITIESADVSPPVATDPLMEEETGGSSVGEASHAGARTAKRNQLRNIAIAAVAVGVAVTAILLVSSNDGHKKH